MLITEEYARQIEESDSLCYYYRDFTTGRYAWVLPNVGAIEPIKNRVKLEYGIIKKDPVRAVHLRKRTGRLSFFLTPHPSQFAM